MSGPWMILVGEDRWRLEDLSSVPGEGHELVRQDRDTPAEHAQQVRQAVDELGSEDNRVLLALPSSWCLAAKIDTDGLERTQRHRAMAFRLEEHLPISAEECVADFLEYSRAEALGICCRLEPTARLIEALEAEGLEVVRMVPEALLGAQAAAAQAGKAGAVAMDSQAARSGLEWVELTQARPSCWRWLADDRDSWIGQIDHWAGREGTCPGRLVFVGVDEPPKLPEAAEPIRVEESVRKLAIGQARKILEGSEEPWVDLRRGPLAAGRGRDAIRRPLTALVAIAAMLLASLTLVFYWRGQQYDELRSRHLSRRQEIFREALPDQTPPLDVSGRMESELRRLTGLRGSQSEGEVASAANQTSAMVHLRNVLAQLPRDIRFRIERLEIGAEEIRVEAQGRSFAEADQVALSLKDSGLYRVEMHETNALGEGKVAFSFSARPEEGFTAARGGEHSP